MATQTATFPVATAAPPSAGVLLPAFTLWWREIVRFYRQRARVVGVIASPLLFWIVIGSGFGSSFRSGQGAGQHYLNYFYPGTLVMIVLFTAIFTMMSVIEDRNEGFLLSVMVAPVPRAAIVLGKVLGGTTLATAQGLIFLVFAPFVGVHFTLTSFPLIVLTIFLVSFSLTALGFAIAWPLDSTQAFHAIINLFLIPLWLLSGALFPTFRSLCLDARHHVRQPADLRSRGPAHADVSRIRQRILVNLLDFDAGPVRAVHVRTRLRSGESSHNEACSVRRVVGLLSRVVRR